jgi:pectinesterase
MAEHFLRPGDDLQRCLDSARPGDCIRLPAGEYRQKCVIRTPGLTLLGEGAEQTCLIWDDYARKPDGHGREYNTFRTWTLAVCADDITMRDLSIINDALHPETKGQEVALTVYGDRFDMENCLLRSTQDTLFLGPLPADLIERYQGFLPDELRRDKSCSQRFVNCRIEGTVDFIFGCGRALFDNCEIRSMFDVRGIGYAAAPAHAPEQTEGFLFRRCAFTCEDTVAPGSVYLARPWRDHGLARFENCRYGAHIAPAGFDPWQDSGRDKTARFYESPAQPGRVAWVR